jgi:hypothetical protein
MKWISRERVKVDRVACPWLIKKFVDQDAEFVFVPPDKVMEEARRLGAVPYDVKDVELGHHGKECSSSTAPTLTTRFITNRKDQGSKRSPRDFAISDTRTITPSMLRSGSSTTPFTPTARKWSGGASPTAIS